MPRRTIATLRDALVLGLLLGAAGCSQSKIAGDGRAPDAPDRIPALVRLAQGGGGGGASTTTGGREDARGLGELVRALEDDDPAVRMFASQGLRERTGQDFGYRYYDSAEHRRPAVRAWRDWLDAQDESTPPATPNTASAPDAQ